MTRAVMTGKLKQLTDDDEKFQLTLISRTSAKVK
jgi:hypothetical protein